jgi:hypothetical protein
MVLKPGYRSLIPDKASGGATTGLPMFIILNDRKTHMFKSAKTAF